MQNAMRAHLAAPIPPELGEISAVLSLAPVHTLAASPSPAAAPSLAAVPGPVAAKRTSSMAAITAPAARRAAHRLPPDTIVMPWMGALGNSLGTTCGDNGSGSQSSPDANAASTLSSVCGADGDRQTMRGLGESHGLAAVSGIARAHTSRYASECTRRSAALDAGGKQDWKATPSNRSSRSRMAVRRPAFSW